MYKRKYKILLVDDNRDYLTALTFQLQAVIKDKIELIDTALNGCEAIEKVKLMFYDFIFMDIDMPVMDGVLTTKYFNKMFPYITIIGMSFHNDFSRVEEMILAGSRYFISKSDIDESRIKEIFE
jgi:YesN/AraC family two-component response regulator